MRNFLITLTLLLTIGIGQAQILDPVRWNTEVVKESDTEYTLVARAIIDQGWHLYSQEIPADGPIPTSFVFPEDASFELLGEITESNGKTEFDPVFEMKIKYFENQAQFRQRIKVQDSETTVIESQVRFMVCDDTRCLPPAYETLTFNLSGQSGNSEQKTEVVKLEKVEPGDQKSGKGLWGIFFIAFLSGFAALLTPCVFPMIPMTVSFFTKQSKDRATGIRNAIFYGIAIIVIYVLLGTVVTAFFGADSLNALATNVWFNLLFFILLVVFACSFLGAFEIVLPSKWATKVDRQADRGGFIGIFFMALALAIVSFSCTGPIVGTLLVEAAMKGGSGPIVGMLGFSTAIALPFGVFAAFPGWLNTLPRSGGWLNSVKVVLGFLELALAFKFLSQADLVLQLHLLEREVFIAIWIAIFGVLAFYLFGKIKLPHDSPVDHISVGRLGLGLVALSFTIYMIPGLWGAPLNLISAFPPPQEYSESPYGVGGSRSDNRDSAAVSELPEGGEYLPPHDILVFKDYEKGMAYAKEVDKPVMLDFTGYACVNCRKMEQNVWAKEKILKILKNEVVLISHYVDDQRTLKSTEIAESQLYPGETIETVGQKWSEFQAVHYNTNTQPFYVLIDHEQQKLIDPVGYTPDVDQYQQWLLTGIEEFENRS